MFAALISWYMLCIFVKQLRGHRSLKNDKEYIVDLYYILLSQHCLIVYIGVYFIVHFKVRARNRSCCTLVAYDGTGARVACGDEYL